MQQKLLHISQPFSAQYIDDFEELPFDFDTLAVRVYQLASDERLSEASTGALAIILAGLVPVVLLTRILKSVHATPAVTGRRVETS